MSIPRTRAQAAPTVTPVLASLSIVMPCFDDEAGVADAIADAHGSGERCAARHEVLVVDDGSRDGTRDIAESIAPHDARVTVIAHERTRGDGAAIRTGIAASSGARVRLSDARREFDLAELRYFVPLTADANLVVGYRVDRGVPDARRVAERQRVRAMRRTFGTGVRDVDCAFKLVRGPAVRALALESDGARISTQLVVHAHRAGWAIAEVAVHARTGAPRDPARGDARAVDHAVRGAQALKGRLHQEADGAHGPDPTVS